MYRYIQFESLAAKSRLSYFMYSCKLMHKLHYFCCFITAKALRLYTLTVADGPCFLWPSQIVIYSVRVAPGIWSVIHLVLALPNNAIKTPLLCLSQCYISLQCMSQRATAHWDQAVLDDGTEQRQSLCRWLIHIMHAAQHPRWTTEPQSVLLERPELVNSCLSCIGQYWQPWGVDEFSCCAS